MHIRLSFRSLTEVHQLIVLFKPGSLCFFSDSNNQEQAVIMSTLSNVLEYPLWIFATRTTP